MFENNSTPCRWAKCELGLKGNHAPWQWKAHQQYAMASPTTMMPPMITPLEIQQNIVDQEEQPKQTYYTPEGKPIEKFVFHKKTWRGLGIGMMIGCWSVITFYALLSVFT